MMREVPQSLHDMSMLNRLDSLVPPVEGEERGASVLHAQLPGRFLHDAAK